MKQLIALMVLCPLMLMVAASSAWAGKGTLTLNQPNPVYGQVVTFTLLTNGGNTTSPPGDFVQETVVCSQGDVEVYRVQQIVYAEWGSKPINWGQPEFTLSGPGWVGGPASCSTVVSKHRDGGGAIAATSFAVFG